MQISKQHQKQQKLQTATGTKKQTTTDTRNDLQTTTDTTPNQTTTGTIKFKQQQTRKQILRKCTFPNNNRHKTND